MPTEQRGLPKTLQQAILYFADKERALEFLTWFRWPDGKPTCPWCGSQENSFVSTRSIWKCKGCKKQFSAKAGTIMEDSPIGLEKWLPAIWMLCGCKNGISSYEIGRDLGVSQKAAWFMLHRIRLAMQNGSFEKKLKGKVEADETFVGGKVANMHLDKQTRQRMGKKRIGGFQGKTVVMGLLERHGEARVKVLPNTRKHHLRGHIFDNVAKGTTIYTDALKSYEHLGDFHDFKHEVIDHTEAYVRDQVIHTNGLENFWSLFKRALKGTYVSVEPFHLQAYADEQAFRFNNRKVDDVDRFVAAVSQIAGKRITWAELTGKELDSQQN
jgi:transposase-like protein